VFIKYGDEQGEKSQKIEEKEELKKVE